MSAIEDIASVIGARGAFELSMARAGTSFYIPADPPPAHWLRDLLTDAEVDALAARFGGETVTMPAAKDNARHRAEQGLRNHLPVRMVALLTGISERRVHGFKSEMIEEGRLQPNGDDNAA